MLYGLTGSSQGLAGVTEFALGFVGPCGVLSRSSECCVGSLKVG